MRRRMMSSATDAEPELFVWGRSRRKDYGILLLQGRILGSNRSRFSHGSEGQQRSLRLSDLMMLIVMALYIQMYENTVFKIKASVDKERQQKQNYATPILSHFILGKGGYSCFIIAPTQGQANQTSHNASQSMKLLQHVSHACSLVSLGYYFCIGDNATEW